MRVRLVGLLALMALVVASCGGVSPEAGGPTEGIQVHGDWTIEVYNEDGALDRTVRFENALTTGRLLLIDLLLSEKSAGKWRIHLNDGNALVGQIFDVSATAVDETGNGFSDFVRLTGTHLFDTEISISEVATFISWCHGDRAPADCPGAEGDAGGTEFSRKVLTSPETVLSGQSVHVQVDISFTSG